MSLFPWGSIKWKPQNQIHWKANFTIMSDQRKFRMWLEGRRCRYLLYLKELQCQLWGKKKKPANYWLVSMTVKWNFHLALQAGQDIDGNEFGMAGAVFSTIQDKSDLMQAAVLISKIQTGILLPSVNVNPSC